MVPNAAFCLVCNQPKHTRSTSYQLTALANHIKFKALIQSLYTVTGTAATCIQPELNFIHYGRLLS